MWQREIPVMLCYVFQTDGQLLCYFPLEANSPTAVENVDLQVRQEAFYSNLTPEERKQFISFCKEKRKRSHLDTAVLTMVLQQPGIALFAERYSCSRMPLQYPDGLSLRLVNNSILDAMNTQYRQHEALVLTLLQHTTDHPNRMDTLPGNTSRVVRYLLNRTGQCYEPEQAVPSPALCAYRNKMNGYAMNETLDLIGIVLFLAEELPKLPLFDTIQICCDKNIQQYQNFWIEEEHSIFLYIFVLTTYFVSICSNQNKAHIAIGQSGDKVCLRVYNTLSCRTHLIETTSEVDQLIQQFPNWREFLLLLHWLMKQNVVPCKYQIVETESGEQRLDVCLYFDPVPKDEIIFRHLTVPNEWKMGLSEMELLLFLLQAGGDVSDL